MHEDAISIGFGGGDGLAAVSAVGTAGCGKYSSSALWRPRPSRRRNELYKASKWKEAATRYEDAVKATRPSGAPTSTLPTATTTSTSRPRKATRTTTATCQKAIEHYKAAAEKDPHPAPQAGRYSTWSPRMDRTSSPTRRRPSRSSSG